VLNKKTKKYEELPKDYKTKFTQVMKRIEESKATELKKPKAIISLIDQINETICES
jgi:DNA-binding ferritin-like protein (Dps family)